MSKQWSLREYGTVERSGSTNFLGNPLHSRWCLKVERVPSRNFELIDFEAAYPRNTVCNLNKTWVVYTGDIVVAMNRK